MHHVGKKRSLHSRTGSRTEDEVSVKRIRQREGTIYNGTYGGREDNRFTSVPGVPFTLKLP